MNEYFRSFPTDDISKRMQMKHCIRRFRSAVELQIGRLEDFMVPTTNTRKKKNLDAHLWKLKYELNIV